MSTDVFWKQVCDRDLPDFDAVERAILAMPAPKRQTRGVFFAAAAVALVLLWAGAAGLVRDGGTVPAPETPEPVLSAPVTEAEKEPAEPQEETPEPQPEADVVVFNQLDGNELGMALDIDMSRILLEHAQNWNLVQIRDYWGEDLLPQTLPEGVTAEFDEESTWKYAAADGLVWDQFSFRYGDGLEVYDPLERTLTVTVAGSEIFQCGINFSAEDLEPSTISGVEMWLGQRQVDYGPYEDGPDGEKIPAGYCPLMEASFQRDGFQIRVTAENLTEDEFVAVLRDMAG